MQKHRHNSDIYITMFVLRHTYYIRDILTDVYNYILPTGPACPPPPSNAPVLSPLLSPPVLSPFPPFLPSHPPPLPPFLPSSEYRYPPL